MNSSITETTEVLDKDMHNDSNLSKYINAEFIPL